VAFNELPTPGSRTKSGLQHSAVFRELVVTPLDQLRLRLPDHDFVRLMEAAAPITVSDRDAFLKDVAAELGQHEVVGPGLLHRIISEVQRRYLATREHTRD
jgi:hypothetical protein